MATTSSGEPGEEKTGFWPFNWWRKTKIITDNVGFVKVFKTELESVRERRKALDRNADDIPNLEADLSPKTHDSVVMREVLANLTDGEQNERWQVAAAIEREPEDGPRDFCFHPGLVGLAFSGGGIRSATFNLGILQALDRCKLWPWVDYLSTVSGGGYLGSCLSSLYSNRTSRTPIPFKHAQGQEEPAAFRHLRNNSNYIAPNGLRDFAGAAALLLRGVAINFLVVLPYILWAAAITVAANQTSKDLTESLAAEFLSGLPYGAYFGNGAFAGTLALGAFVLFSFMLYPVLRLFVHRFTSFASSGWGARNWAMRLYGTLLCALGIAAFLEFQPWAILTFQELLREDETEILHGLVPGLSAAVSLLGPIVAGKLSSHVDKWSGRIGIYVTGLLGFAVFWILYLYLCVWAIDFAEAGASSTVWGSMGPDLYFAVGGGLFLYTLLFVDINSTSLHAFYRDRLSKAYLIKFPDGEDFSGRLRHNDAQKLSTLKVDAAPYHLINAAINLEEPEEAHKRGRMADTFLFSKYFIGGPPTGYCHTKAMESVDKHVNLGTAMAISGAAFAATAGKATIKPLVFLMAMLNVRLNYWLPNPSSMAVERYSLWFGSLRRVGPFYLLRELLGMLDAKSENVDISDGGHFENLGVYELLRRNCRIIIVGDGECDPGLKFEAVSELVRLAQVDMGIKIEMTGLDKIREGGQHYAIGKIRYTKERHGILVYLKSSLLKDDSLEASLETPDAYLSSQARKDDRQFDANPYIANYKRLNPAFPHQTTADQFFDERQFECYRALGYMVAMRSLGDMK